MSSTPSTIPRRHLGRVAIALLVIGTVALADDFAPKPDERQLPYAMHSEMSERPTITVGRTGADLIGADNRASRRPSITSRASEGGSSRSARAST